MNLTDGNITLGSAYRDDATGFWGVATAHTKNLGCTSQVCLEKQQPDGTIIAAWFALGRLSFASSAAPA